MFADVDYSQLEVRQDVRHWGEWIGRELKLGGMRLDAIKHYSEHFLKTFILHLDRTVGRDWFFVGEYWSGDVKVLSKYLQGFKGRLSLFDVPLVYRFSHASSARKYDLRRIFSGSLCKRHPKNAVVCLSMTNLEVGVR
jgi:alpha-amylase